MQQARDNFNEESEGVRKELATRTLCRRRLLPFVLRNVPEYEAGWVHKEICEKLEQFEKDVVAKKSPRLMIFMPPRTGKNLVDRTDIFTYNRGLITHGELKVNDSVQHPSGEPTKVVAVSEKMPCNYEVEVTDGSKIKCHGNHEWTIWDRSYQEWKTYETQWFTAQTKHGNLRKLSTGETGKRGGRYKYQLPLVAGPVVMKEATQDLPPYFVGIWLGDGSSKGGTICFDPRRSQHIEKIERQGLCKTSQWAHNNTDKYENVAYAGFGGDKVTTRLKAVNLYDNKHIPESYLISSVDQRMELLAGLIDSDGSVDHKSRVMFSNTNKKLIDGYFQLCQSLNLRPYWMKEELPKLSSSGIQGRKTVYKVGFQPPDSGPDIPTVVKLITRRTPQRKLAIKSVRKLTDEEIEYGHCIQVEAKDGLYLAGKTLIATHNSELASTQFPSWFLGRNPGKEIISCSYASALAMNFSRKVRELLRDPKYHAVFPDTQLKKDSQSTANWVTTQGGGYLAAGVDGPITGMGADALIIDDPIKNRKDAESPTDRENVWNWYSSTAYSRLSPGGGVLIILTRWHSDDLAGRLLAKMKKGGDQWDIVVYPAIAIHDEKYRKEGEALHPARYDEVALARIKKAMIARDWGALYQQQPTTEEGAILKRQYWCRWRSDKPPICEYTIQSYDTAYSKKETADFSVITTWGLFHPDGDYSEHTVMVDGEETQDTMFDGTESHIILLDVVKVRLDFPQLKEKAYELYSYWQPDSTIIEAKASGLPLAHELRRMGIPVQTFTPSRGNDKLTRVHSVTDLFASGNVWAPVNEWAEDLIEECHAFPAGKHDDQVDSTTQALMRFRQGGFISLITDDDEEFVPRRRMSYY